MLRAKQVESRGAEKLVEVPARDVKTWSSDPALEVRYAKQEGTEKLAHDLKPKPERFRTSLRELLDLREERGRRAVTCAGAFGTRIATELKPTALHFAAGQQEFLATVGQLVNRTKGTPGVDGEDIREALWGPWRYRRPLPVLGWDGTASPNYALQASDPSTDKKLGVPGTDWLGFRGLALLPVSSRGDRIATPRCSGGRKDGYFQWPVWTVGLEAEVVRSVFGPRGHRHDKTEGAQSARAECREPVARQAQRPRRLRKLCSSSGRLSAPTPRWKKNHGSAVQLPRF